MNAAVRDTEYVIVFGVIEGLAAVPVPRDQKRLIMKIDGKRNRVKN